MTVPVLLLAVALASPQQEAPQRPSTPAPASGTSSTEQQRRVDEPQGAFADRKHTVGVGGQLGVSSRGAGAGGRFFFGERLGINLNAFWYRGDSRYSIGGVEPGSSYGTFPSFIYMLTKPNGTGNVDIRPYIGAGMSYVSSSRIVVGGAGPGVSPVQQRIGGVGGQVFGGVEMTFREVDWMTISAEGIYYRLPVRVVNSTVMDGFNYVLGFHFYLK